MSRIYQGGTSDSNYRAQDRRVAYNAEQAISSERAIKEQAARQQRDAETKRRETTRANQVADMERQAADKVANLDLQILQQQTKNKLDIAQKVESNQLANDSRLKSDGLKMSQTNERADVSITQLSEKNALSANQLRARNTLKLEQTRETNLLRSEQSAIKADQGLAQTHSALSARVANANAQVVSTAVNGLISFAGEYAEAANEYAEQKKVEDDALSWFNSGAGTVVTDDGSINPIVEADNRVPDIVTAQETAVQQVAKANNLTGVEADQIRTDSRTQRNTQNINVIGVNDAAAAIPAVLQDAWNAGTKIELPNGVVLDPRAMSGAMDVQAWSKAIVSDFVRSSGLASMDAAAVAKTLLPSAVNSTAAFTANKGAEVVKGLQDTSISIAKERAATSLEAGQVPLQDVWDNLSADYWGSGKYTSRAAANEAAIKALLPYLSTTQLQALDGVTKINGNPGTKLTKEYGPLIEAAIRGERTQAVNDARLDRAESTANVNELKEAHTRAILNAETPEEIQQAHLDYEAGLLANDSPEALAEYQTQQGISNNRNPFAIGQLMEQAEAGNPISTEQGAELVDNGTLTPAELKALGQMGGIANQAAVASAEEIKGDVKAAVTGIVANTLDSNGFPVGDKVTDRSLAPIISDINDRAMRALVAFNAENGGDVPEGQQRAFIQQWVKQNVPGLLNDVTWDADTATVNGYSYSGTEAAKQAVATVYTNPVTNKPARSLTTVPTNNLRALNNDNIPGNDLSPVNDRLITRQELAATVDALKAGQPVPARVEAIAKIAGITPKSLAIYQGMGQGIDIEGVLSEPPAPTTAGPSDTSSGAKYIQSSLGFPAKGAAYLSSNIATESSWNGMRDWGQVAGDGTSRNGGLVSWASWSTDPARLGKIENYLGKDISQATHAEQLAAMQWEMKTFYKEAYRIFMNPRATDAQLRRASIAYWGYRDEGERFGSHLATAKRALGIS